MKKEEFERAMSDAYAPLAMESLAPLASESTEAGRNWPHGERGAKPHKLPVRPVQPLSDEMRALMERSRVESFIEGKVAGRREMANEYMGNGIISMAVGTVLGWCLHYVWLLILK